MMNLVYIYIYKLYILCSLVLSYPPTVDVMPWRARPTQRHKTFGVRWPEPKCTKRCCKLGFLRFRNIYRINKLRELHQNYSELKDSRTKESMLCSKTVSICSNALQREAQSETTDASSIDWPCSNKDNKVKLLRPPFSLGVAQPATRWWCKMSSETKGCCRDESLQSEALRLYDILKTNIKAFEPKCHSTITYNYILNRTQSLSFSVASTQSGT